MSLEPVADLAGLKGTNCQFKFIGEGAANIVFEIIFPEGQGNGDSNILSILQGHYISTHVVCSPYIKLPLLTTSTGKLLRVPKANTKAFPHPEILQYWSSSISPLFDNPQHDLVQQYLVRLGEKALISHLNAVLENEDGQGQRRADFQGTRVAEAEYGMLVEDMRKSEFVLT